MKRILKIGVIVATIALAGCATGSKPENMVYQGGVETYDAELKANVRTGAVSGGQKTKRSGISQISNEAFAAALKETLKLQGLLSSGGRYELEASLINISQSPGLLYATVATSIKYVLTDTQTDAVATKEIIDAHGTAMASETFNGGTRIRLANERSAKNNIEQFLFELSKLKIKGVSVE